MSKLLDPSATNKRRVSGPAGFGAARTARLPGLALVGLVASDHKAGLAAASQAGLEAVLVSGVGSAGDARDLAESASDIPWGICRSSLSGEDAQVCAEAGADVLAFGLESAASSMAGEDELARILTVAPDLSDRQLRAVAALPVDCFTVDMTAVTGAWTLEDLVTVGSISRRTDKYVLVQVSTILAKDDLAAVRDMGASAIILDLSGVSPEDLAGLKTALLEMPRPRRRRDRARATVPSSGFASAPTPSREDDDDDDDYDDYD